ncbi:hypothetical protein [Xenorhabdus szentirmaii]|uniref:hypothetical protein n=1 Tax=Xenorhabdus szentirmaii TaxID=290112 RepID=UPI0019AF0E05|nr:MULTISPECIES: hypothetical protein [unclassified Xenorhabdus]MBD2792039.1 hypothetical protein [Xenorhabdus sp. CUL]MBD2823955.1 hypothetical protein [Xenorhabdus sp. 5]
MCWIKTAPIRISAAPVKRASVPVFEKPQKRRQNDRADRKRDDSSPERMTQGIPTVPLLVV